MPISMMQRFSYTWKKCDRITIRIYIIQDSSIENFCREIIFEMAALYGKDAN